MRVQAKVWRHIPVGAYALHVGRILRADGRWNRPGVYGCLHTALSEQGLDLSSRGSAPSLPRQTGTSRRRDVVSINVDLDPVVDLTNPETSPVPPNTPFLTGDRPEDIEQCRALADALRAAGYVGIFTQSAAAPGEKNLIIYIDGPTRGIQLDDGGDRIPLE